MKAAIRKGILGYTFSFANNYAKPAYRSNKGNTNDVLIQIKSAGINPVDYKLPRALLGPVIGFDFCGTITDIGDQVEVDQNFKVGDLVFGNSLKGSVAEYSIAKANTIAKVPTTSNWKPSECAALPVAYQSALQCLRRGGIIDTEGTRLQSDKSVLVIGASGGCGIAGLQLCRAVGVSRIVAICSKKNEQLVKDMGATEVVNYTDLDELESFFRDNAAKLDVVYDAATSSGAGEDYWDRSIPLLKTENGDSGHYASLNGSRSKWIRKLTGREKDGQSLILMKANTKDLELIVSLLDRTGARPLVKIMPFNGDGLKQAFDELKGRRTTGKIVFDIS
mmetsp:Transcript_27075/g.31983  ORF Transcript_27075/g.31983 Transcript_27075/m.31983 type:complete len:335 (+) Transcript_27075:76-1080(+)